MPPHNITADYSASSQLLRARTGLKAPRTYPAFLSTPTQETTAHDQTIQSILGLHNAIFQKIYGETVIGNRRRQKATNPQPFRAVSKYLCEIIKPAHNSFSRYANKSAKLANTLTPSSSLYESGGNQHNTTPVHTPPHKQT
jgi:hypothetical protein